MDQHGCSSTLDEIASKRRNSIGKRLRHRYSQPTKSDEILHSDERGDLPEKIRAYISYLEENGLVYNREVASLAILKDFGLSLIARKTIIGETEIVRVPHGVMLDTKKVFENDGLSKVICDNLNLFAPDEAFLIEDRVLLLALIYEYQRGEESKYYHMISNFSRDINIGAFFERELLLQFHDDYLLYWAKDQQQFFFELAEVLNKQVILKNPDVFKGPEITVDIIQWLYTHIVTRTFGIADYVTFVPFAEFLNHGYVSAYGEFGTQTKQLNQEEQEFLSDDSYSSSENQSTGTQDLGEDYLKEFDNSLIQIDNQISPNLISCIGLTQEQKDLMTKSSNQQLRPMFSTIIMNFINDFDLGVNVNAVIFAKVLAKLKKIETQQPENQDLATPLDRIEKMLEFLLFLIEDQQLKRKPSEDNYNHKVFKGLKQSKKMWDINKEQKVIFVDRSQCQPYESNVFRFSEYESVTRLHPLLERRSSNAYQWFSLKVNSRLYYHRHIKQHQQILYQYGRLSNRSFLTRYGFTLEWNKYESHYIKINCTQTIAGISQEATLYMNHFKVKNTQAFKVRYTQFCFELLSYCRSLVWDLERDSLESIFNPRKLSMELVSLQYMQELVQKELCKWQQYAAETAMCQLAVNYHLAKCHLLEHNVQLIGTAIDLVTVISNKADDATINKKLTESDAGHVRLLRGYIKDLIKGVA